eukprot:1085814-Amorphochlora_amoeboformis.AAC.1
MGKREQKVRKREQRVWRTESMEWEGRDSGFLKLSLDTVTDNVWEVKEREKMLRRDRQDSAMRASGAKERENRRKQVKSSELTLRCEGERKKRGRE